MTNKLILIAINFFLFSLFAYLVQYEKQLDKVCNEIIKDYNRDLESKFMELQDISKKHYKIKENADKIRNCIESLIRVKNLNEADSTSLKVKQVIRKLGWNFELDYINHRDLGLSIINQFMDKFDAEDKDAYDPKFHIVFNKQIEKGDSIHLELTPVFAHSNFDSIWINGVYKTCENPFFYKDSVLFVLFYDKNNWKYKLSLKTKDDEE